MDAVKQFNKEKALNIRKQGRDNKLDKLAINFINRSAKYKYVYNFTWLGRPIIQLPQDIVMIQELIWDIKPDFIIETGIAHGGSLILSASILELIGKGRVIGVDIEIRPHNLTAIKKHPLNKRITMIEGSSTDEKVIKKISKIVKGKKAIVFLDSLHTGDHVFTELQLYSQFVSINSYLVAFDTIISRMNDNIFSNRPWSKKDNPATAVKKFLKLNKQFIIDKNIDSKLLLSSALGGFLKRIK